MIRHDLEKLLKPGGWFLDDAGFHIRFDADTIPGLLALKSLVKGAVRPVKSHGGAYTDKAFAWFTIPVRRELNNTLSWGNDPPKRRKRGS